MLTKQELKEKLLQSKQLAGKYIDNEYLDRYLDLITSPTVIQGYSELHHIQPRSYFKYNNLVIDSSTDNIVRLVYKDHIKAHYYLYYCTTDKLQTANAAMVMSSVKLLSKNKKLTDLTETDFIEVQEYIDAIRNDTNSKYWTDEELTILLHLTPRSSNKKRDDFKILFPNKTYEQVLSKAVLLGIKIGTIPWTTEEDNLLKQYFPIIGQAVINYLPNRTVQACARRARLLGLKHSLIWTKEELATLIKYYSEEGGNVAKRLPNRNSITCKMKAKELGLVYKNTWTEKQVQILKQYYKKEGARGVAQRLNKQVEACRQKACKLGLTRKDQ